MFWIVIKFLKNPGNFLTRPPLPPAVTYPSVPQESFSASSSSSSSAIMMSSPVPAPESQIRATRSFLSFYENASRDEPVWSIRWEYIDYIKVAPDSTLTVHPIYGREEQFSLDTQESIVQFFTSVQLFGILLQELPRRSMSMSVNRKFRVHFLEYEQITCVEAGLDEDMFPPVESKSSNIPNVPENPQNSNPSHSSPNSIQVHVEIHATEEEIAKMPYPVGTDSVEWLNFKPMSTILEVPEEDPDEESTEKSNPKANELNV